VMNSRRFKADMGSPHPVAAGFSLSLARKDWQVLGQP
jgi:hypothetical protein